MSDVPGLATDATTHAGLLGWVREIADLTQPDRVEWADGSADEWRRITDLLVVNRTFTRLDPTTKPNSFWCASDPADVARVEDRTFICSQDERDAGVFAALRDAALARSDAERSIRAAVDDARTHGYSWAFIGSLLGTSGEAARQRYGTKQEV